MDIIKDRNLKQPSASIKSVIYLPVCIEHQCLASTYHRYEVAAESNTCPENLEQLTNLLVRDLPSYANRPIQKRRKLTDPVYSSILAASRPDFKSIEIASREYPPHFPQSAPTQVFITTLERQYTGIKAAELQQFHWLFLVKTQMGWRLANLYSRTGTTRGAESPTTPPIESSKTSIGEAIRLWLDNCHLGKVKG
jgi:hypothetical protein